MLSFWCLGFCLITIAVALDIEEFSSSDGEDFTLFKPIVRAKRLVKDKEKKKLTQSDRIEFVNAHNLARRTVDPPAEGMPMMTWNDTLENYAQRWALNCEFKHGQPDSNGPKMGQNLWMGSGGYNATGSVSAWDKERGDYTLDPHGCADGKVCGHYTQVVWTKTTQVGCGIAHCIIKGKSQWLIVCNYHKPGNLRGHPPYVAGTSCSNCPDGFTAECTDKLCRTNVKPCHIIECKNGEKLDTSTCLCECGDEDKGPWCGDHPLGDFLENSGTSVRLVTMILLLPISVLVIFGFSKYISIPRLEL